MKKYLIIISIGMLLLFMIPANAYEIFPYTWEQDRVSVKCTALNNSTWQSAAKNAMSNWSTTGADFSYYSTTNTGHVTILPGITDDPYNLAQDLASNTYYRNGKYYRGASTIIINTDCYSWSASSSCPSNRYDVENVLAHELGHSLGLNHSNVSGATMVQGSSMGMTSKRSLETDDKDGAKAIYGV